MLGCRESWNSLFGGKKTAWRRVDADVPAGVRSQRQWPTSQQHLYQAFTVVETRGRPHLALAETGSAAAVCARNLRDERHQPRCA